MTRRKSFSTAAARRRAEPFIWDIDGTEVHLKPTVDLGELANEIAVMQADGPPGETEVAKAARLVAALRTFLGEFVDE